MNTSTKICLTICFLAFLATMFIAIPSAYRQNIKARTDAGLVQCLTKRGYVEWVDKISCQ